MLDRVGLTLLVGLLVSPAVFKIQLGESLVVHPVAAILLVAWFWVAKVVASPLRRSRRGEYAVEWQSWNVPMFLIALWLIGLTLSLIINNVRVGSVQVGGWLLLLKWSLYLSPLPFAVLLVMRSGRAALRLTSWLVPCVALMTVLYSFYQLRNGIGLNLQEQYVISSPEFQALGMLSEVWTSHGLQVRTDTVSQGAYGLYLVLVCMFSLLMGLFRGWGGIVSWRYSAAQAVIVPVFALMGILFSGSRTSLLVLVGCFVILAGMVIANPLQAVQAGDRRSFFLIASGIGLLLVTAYMVWHPFVPTLDRLNETVQTVDRISGQYALSPEAQRPETRQVLRNVQTRVWLWEQVTRYLYAHPFTILVGVGYDRRVFVEQVLGLPYTRTNFQYQTAHSLLLDILVKGGLLPFVSLIALYAWLLWETILGMTIPVKQPIDFARVGLAWMLVCFWPPFLIANCLGEEMFTDNLLLHWTLLAGVLLGLCAVALRERLPGHIAHVTATAGLGGGPAYITALAKHQSSRGTHIRVFCSDEKPYTDIWRNMGLSVSVLPMRTPNIASVWALFREWLHVPALIHAHGRGAAFFAVVIKILVRIPVIYQPHGPHYAFKKGYRYVSGWIFEWCARLIFDAVIYVSVGEKEMADRQKLYKGRSQVVLSGLVRGLDQPSVCSSTRERMRHTLGIPANAFVIGWVGRFQHQKGLDILLESVPLVASRVPQAMWVVIGEGSEEDAMRYREWMALPEVVQRVRFLGGRTDTWDLIRAFDLYVSTSRWEGLPLVLLEVMEQGVPIAASDVVGNRDVLADWGELFAPPDACAAAEAQVRLASDDTLRSRLVDIGREVRRTQFTSARMLEDMDAAYREILGEEITGNARVDHSVGYGGSVVTRSGEAHT